MYLFSSLPRPIARFSRVLAIASGVGVLAGLAAAALEYGLHLGSEHLIGRFTDLGEAHTLSFRIELVLLPAMGGLAAGLLVYWLNPRIIRHGTDLFIHAFHQQRGELAVRGPAVNAAVAVGVISTGGSAGPEGPVAALGAAIGSFVGKIFVLTPRERRVMLIAGCSAGIGAIFRCPLGGALFAASVLYRESDFETDAIAPACFSSVVGYSVYMSFWGYGHYLLRDAETLVFLSPLELIPYLILGITCGLMCFVFRSCLRVVNRLVFQKCRIPLWLAPGLGGLATGLIACLFPQVMDGQYVFIENAMTGNFANRFEIHSWYWWGALFGAVTLAKCVATGFTIGSGAPGGILGPSVFIGGALGACVGAMVVALAPNAFTNDPENLRRALIPVGMAGFLSASMRTPLASLVMVTEMTGSYGLIVPLMLVCMSAYIVGRRWGLSTEQLRRAPESPAHAGDLIVHILEAESVRQVIRKDWNQVVCPEASLRELIELAQPGTNPEFAVVADGQIIGMISLPDIKEVIEQPMVSDVIIASDIMNHNFPTVYPDDNLYHALTVMARSDHHAIPVIEHGTKNKFVGMHSRSDIYGAIGKRLDDMREHFLLEHEDLAAIQREEAIHHLITGVSLGKSENIQLLFIPIQAVGKSLRESNLLEEFGVRVIAIEQADGTIQFPPDMDSPLQTNQRLIAITSHKE